VSNPEYSSGPGNTAAAPASEERASVWEDFIDIFFTPASVFRRREHGSWALPMLVVTLALTILAFTNSGVLTPMIDAEFQRQSEIAIRNNPQITMDQMESMRGVTEKIQKFGTIVFIPVMIFVVGFMTWIVAKLVDARQELHAALVVAAYSQVPRVVQSILIGVQGLLVDPAKLTSRFALDIGPARFFDPDATSQVTLAMLNRFDLFTIWVTILLAVGVYATGRVSKQRAAVAGLLFWIVGSIPALLGALRAS
jgi:hypothetical protein